MKSYSPYQFTLFRIILGIYLVFHFAFLISYAPEVWSNQGIFPDPSINLTYGVIPNLLYLLESAIAVQLFIGVGLILSLLFTVGLHRNWMAFFIWYIWICLFDRNNLISNPGIPYIGWLLLCCAVIPKGEPLSLSSFESEKPWTMPVILFVGAWILMSVGYTISGIDKYNAPSWRNGTAIFHLLENPLARDWWLREVFLALPMSILKVKTWGILLIEICFLPLAIWSLTRKWIWLAMILMHLGILMIVDFADLTIGMLMIHLFTFDGSWLKPKNNVEGIVYFDGVCGMCNNLVDTMMQADNAKNLKYTPLQGETAAERLEKDLVEKLNTVAYEEDGKVYTQSSAILKMFDNVGGIWRLSKVFYIIPKSIRDVIYNAISKNRYKWFGKKEACRMPTKEERAQFLN